MHEVAHVHAAARELLERAPDVPLASVTLDIGPRVVDDVARTAWHDAVAGTRAESAQLELRHVQAQLQCLDCSHPYLGDKLTMCPQCQGNGLVVQMPEEVVLAQWTSSA